MYLTEPYFTKPTDTIVNLTAILLALIAVKDREHFIAYDQFLTVVFVLLIFSLLTILASNRPKPKWLDRLQSIGYTVVTTLGSSKIVFSAMYLLVLVSFFTKHNAEFWALLTFFLFVITQFAYEDLVLYLNRIWNRIRSGSMASQMLGVAIGKENPYLFKVEVDAAKSGSLATKVGSLVYIQADNKRGLLGVIANEKSLINRTWLTVYLLASDNQALCYDFKTNTFAKTNDFFSPNNHVFSINIDELDDDTQKEIKANEIYKNTENIIGYVSPGSNIGRIKFEVLPELGKTNTINEGTIVHTRIHNETCLYQVIDGQTDEENLEKHDSSGYTTGIAQKLGRYDQSARELKVVKWLPDIYTPVYISATRTVARNRLSIGVLPGTKLALDVKETDSLVTHNTAILGILGIGKSMLTFELVQKVLENTSAKVIAIDITNEYKNKLSEYTNESIDVDDENAFNSINGKFDFVYSNNGRDDHTKSGNVAEYRDEVRKSLMQFFFDQESVPDDKVMSGTKRIKIFNPDYHKASKGEKMGYSAITVELSQAEKVRIITEEAFKILMQLGVNPALKARVLFVFEEAHSLIPEWNSTANEGDRSAVNGTAKVILQGRKYGLGSFVVTQRTANISKSILNQCNTIFALRVFDDTGKQFLENYVGSDYANALPTLEERHAVAVGKALRLKQPVILQLNDKDSVIISSDS
jgi:DNA helicase HerA-like ATPase